MNFQNGISCGGAYIKLLSGEAELNKFHEKTPYSIMFGPDKCGLTSKVRGLRVAKVRGMGGGAVYIVRRCSSGRVFNDFCPTRQIHFIIRFKNPVTGEVEVRDAALAGVWVVK